MSHSAILYTLACRSVPLHKTGLTPEQTYIGLHSYSPILWPVGAGLKSASNVANFTVKDERMLWGD